MAIPSAVLNEPSESQGMRILNSNNDQAMITMTGFNCASFDYLLNKFQAPFDSNTPHSNDLKIHKKAVRMGGRPRKICAKLGLGLYLAWTRTNGRLYILQLLFGLNKSAVSLYVRFARRILDMLLSHDDLARIKRPSPNEIETFKQVIGERYPHIRDGVFTMDGLKLLVNKPTDEIAQNRFYNGWKSSHWVVNVFVFSPDGRIVLAGINMPGNSHDSKVAHDLGIYKTLKKVYDATGAKTIVDSAFQCAAQYQNLFYRSGQDDPTPRGRNNPEENALAVIINREATSYRQSSEWGMGALQRSFPRLNEQLSFEESGERQKIIKVFCLLFNLRTALVGQNQIRTVFFRERNILTK